MSKTVLVITVVFTFATMYLGESLVSKPKIWKGFWYKHRTNLIIGIIIYTSILLYILYHIYLCFNTKHLFVYGLPLLGILMIGFALPVLVLILSFVFKIFDRTMEIFFPDSDDDKLSAFLAEQELAAMYSGKTLEQHTGLNYKQYQACVELMQKTYKKDPRIKDFESLFAKCKEIVIRNNIR